MSVAIRGNVILVDYRETQVIRRKCVEWLCGAGMLGNVIIYELHEGPRELIDFTW